MVKRSDKEDETRVRIKAEGRGLRDEGRTHRN